jgi:hypothetical protein
MTRGRIAVTGVARDREVFRVPSLRNVAVTAPYFHDGRRVQVVQIRTNRLKGRLVSSSRSNVLRGTQARRVFRRAMPS